MDPHAARVIAEDHRRALRRAADVSRLRRSIRESVDRPVRRRGGGAAGGVPPAA